jgi:hypothetical protein
MPCKIIELDRLVIIVWTTELKISIYIKLKIKTLFLNLFYFCVFESNFMETTNEVPTKTLSKLKRQMLIFEL